MPCAFRTVKPGSSGLPSGRTDSIIVDMSDSLESRYDALLLVSFGGPERKADVLPFLENVLRGKPVPRERMLEVAEHYYHFGGASPINEQNRALIRALEAELQTHGPKLPVYWGNRNWTPYLADALRQMQADGVRRALAFFTSAFSSYSGCRQYLENIEQARAEVGPGDARSTNCARFSTIRYLLK